MTIRTCNTVEDIIKHDCQAFTMGCHEGEGVIVYKHFDMYFAFQATNFVGKTTFIDHYTIKELDKLVELVDSWT